MSYAQWVSVTIKSINCSLNVRNVVLEYGKLYSGTKDNEVQLDKVNGVTIKAGDSFTISACGREDSPSGTEGSFDLYDGDVHVGSYYWDCPWGSKSNSSTWTPGSDNYIGQQTGANLDSGALGNVTLKIVNLN